MEYINQKNENWILPKPIDADDFKNDFLEPPLNILMHRRGYKSNEDIYNFIKPTPLPNSYDHFPQLRKAVDRLIKANSNNENIAICGDYDADGITSSVLLSEVLNKIGAKPKVFIPNRINEGYGLNKCMIRDLNKQNIKLIITVDNGVSALEALDLCKEYSIDVIITDHHKINNELDNIFALIHPDTLPKNSPYKFLAGVGLAYILSEKLLEFYNLDINDTDIKAYFSIGTIADMTPLLGANRQLIKDTITSLINPKSFGLKKLCKYSKLSKEISTDDIAYKLAPRINSVGRISDPMLILELFQNKDQANVIELSKRIESINSKRKTMCAELEKIVLQFLQYQDLTNKNFIIIKNKTWHSGIIGIIAARIIEKYNKPVAVLTQSSEGYYRASVRAPKDFNLIDILNRCHDLFESYGGHKAAAGFTIKESNLNKLSIILNKLASEYPSEIFIKTIQPEVNLKFNDINQRLFNDLERISPFGVGNPKPLFWSRACTIEKVFLLTGGHAQLTISQGSILLKAVHWSSDFNYRTGMTVDLIYSLDKFTTKSVTTAKLRIHSARIHSKTAQLKVNNRIYKCKSNDEGGIIVENEKGETLNTKNDYLSVCKGSLTKKGYLQKLVGSANIALGLAA